MKLTKSFLKTLNFVTFFSLIFGSSLCLFSCKKKDSKPQNEVPQIKQISTNHTWYYFSDNNYVKIDKPQNAPENASLPWTEALRISCANCNYAEQGVDAFAIVNRLGILSFENDKITLSKDINLFKDRTAGNLVFLGTTPVFSVYKSSFFNDSIKNQQYKTDDSMHLFLLQFDPLSKISYPIINCTNLCEETNTEITDFSWDGLTWLCSLKTITDSKNSFSYIKWKPNSTLLSLTPSTATNNISLSAISAETFRNSKQPSEYSQAPKRIKKMLSGFADKKSFSLELKTVQGVSPRKYQNLVSSYTEKELIAKGLIAESWSSVLFEDGTLFIEGALPGKHILRGGKTVAIRLPKLPGGYVYSDFVISGTTLYAAWEQADFYTTKRSGFISINLEKTLYNKLL